MAEDTSSRRMGRLMRRSMSGGAGAPEDGGQEKSPISKLIAKAVADEGPVIAGMSKAEAEAELADVEAALATAGAAYADAVARAALVRARLLEIEANGGGDAS